MRAISLEESHNRFEIIFKKYYCKELVTLTTHKNVADTLPSAEDLHSTNFLSSRGIGGPNAPVRGGSREFYQ